MRVDMFTSRLLFSAVVAAVYALATPVVQAQVVRTTAAAQATDGRYIVTLKPSVNDVLGVAQRLLKARGGKPERTFGRVMKGFSAQLSAGDLQALRAHPDVLAIEPDVVVSIAATQSAVTWGLDRIDQAALPLNGSYTYNPTGLGVRAYIIDTGVRATHADISGRVLQGYTAVADGYGTEDCNGHGTHVAGTVGGSSYGVAKQVSLVPVRVLGCDGSGSLSGVIAGLDWVATQSHRPAVANMSLGSGASTALDTAVNGAVNAGVTVVVAAGNSNVDACTASPARVPAAITVGATTSSDARASYSNFGPCLDVFAPGSAITSAWYTADTAVNTISGTSMASPHVAGVAAQVLQQQPSATPAMVASAIFNGSTANRVSGAGKGSPNRLLNGLQTTGGSAGGGEVAPPEATAVVAIKGLSARALLGRTSWQGEVTVTVHNVSSGALVGGATVLVGFDPGGNTSCVTSATTGSCTVRSTGLKYRIAGTVATVTGVRGTGVSYDATQNSVTSVRITP